MKILVVDSIPAAYSTLARGLKNTLGCEVLCASSPQEALLRMRTEKDTIGVFVRSLELGPEPGLSFIQQMMEYCKAAAVRTPRFVMLTPGPLPPGDGRYESRFRIIGAECLLQGNEAQLHTTVRRMMFELACEKGRPTIIVDRSDPETRFFILGVARSQLILCRPSLIPIFNYRAIHFGTAISTRTLAEVMWSKARQPADGGAISRMDQVTFGVKTFPHARLALQAHDPLQFGCLRKMGRNLALQQRHHRLAYKVICQSELDGGLGRIGKIDDDIKRAGQCGHCVDQRHQHALTARLQHRPKREAHRRNGRQRGEGHGRCNRRHRFPIHSRRIHGDHVARLLHIHGLKVEIVGHRGHRHGSGERELRHGNHRHACVVGGRRQSLAAAAGHDETAGRQG